MTRDGAPFDEMCEPGLRERMAADPLSQYKKKRQFDETPEPEGEEAGGGNKHRFVIQRHKAKKAGEHFDLRLENDEGAMSSWSIPKHKLPSGTEKLLAVQTEDHPLEYRTFKGTIPEGEYGAGEMGIHDSGTYEEIDWGKTRIVFRLKGKKEKGAYKLFKTDGKRWMIMAAKDEDLKKQEADDEDEPVVGLNEELLVAFTALRRSLLALSKAHDLAKREESARLYLKTLSLIRRAFPSPDAISQDVLAQSAVHAAFYARGLADLYADADLKAAADHAWRAIMDASDRARADVDIPFADDPPLSVRAINNIALK